VSGWSSALRTRIYGEPPGPGATPLAGLLYTRRVLARLLLAATPLYLAAGLAIEGATTWGAVGFMALIQLCGIALLGHQIRKERSRSGTLR
jgi:hypothetical protein